MSGWDEDALWACAAAAAVKCYSTPDVRCQRARAVGVVYADERTLLCCLLCTLACVVRARICVRR
jgi:hypothetical protein